MKSRLCSAGYVLLVMMGGTVTLTSVAHAQEIVPQWRRSLDGQTYATERSVQVAIETWLTNLLDLSEPVRWGVRGHSMNGSDVIMHYGVHPTPLKKTEWRYYYGGYVYNTEDALITAMRTGNDDFCPVSVPDPVWEVTEGVGDKPENSTSEDWWDGVTISHRNLNGGCLAPFATNANRSRTVECPNRGALKWFDEVDGCTLQPWAESSYQFGLLYSRSQIPKLCHGVGNPCDPTTGDKFQSEVDLELGWIRLERHYHSLVSTADGGFGPNWTHGHNLRMAIGMTATTVPMTPGFIDSDGSHVVFQQKTGYVFEARDGSGDRAVRDTAGWTLHRRDEVIYFTPIGRVLRREREDGTSLTYTHDSAGRLLAVTHSTGRSLALTYLDAASRNIASISVNGVPYALYGYGENGQLATVTFQDGATREYHYEDVRFPSHLTGVTAEDGRRYSWFAYDGKGRVRCSQHEEGCVPAP